MTASPRTPMYDAAYMSAIIATPGIAVVQLKALHRLVEVMPGGGIGMERHS